MLVDYGFGYGLDLDPLDCKRYNKACRCRGAMTGAPHRGTAIFQVLSELMSHGAASHAFCERPQCKKCIQMGTAWHVVAFSEPVFSVLGGFETIAGE
jgi:hypothetical protein